MRIITDSGDEITVTNRAKQQRILGFLFHVSNDETRDENAPVRRKKHRKVLGNKAWTEEEEKTLLDYPRLTPPTLRELSIRYHRTPAAIYAKHHVLRKQHQQV